MLDRIICTLHFTLTDPIRPSTIKSVEPYLHKILVLPEEPYDKYDENAVNTFRRSIISI